MGKRGEVQKGFLVVVVLILALVAFVSYAGRGNTGNVVRTSTQDTFTSSYKGLCGACDTILSCEGVAPGGSCMGEG